MKTFGALVVTGLLLVSSTGVRADGGKEGMESSSLALASLPAPVQATIKAQSAGGKIRKIWTETEDGRTSYVAKIVVKARKFEAEVAGDGTLLGTEEPVKIGAVPPAVRETITKTLAGRKLKELEIRTEQGKTFYEFVIKGVEGEIAVAADGTILPGEAERAEKR